MAEIDILLNGALAPPFHPYRKDERLATPAGWAPWWLAQRDDDPHWRHQVPVFGPQPVAGRPVARVASPRATHTAGLLQQVPAVAGDRYELRAEALAFSSEDESPGQLVDPGDVNLQLGLDPAGGLDPTSPHIRWSRPVNNLGEWTALHLVAEAQAAIMTAYLRSAPSFPRRQQEVFWRLASLQPLGQYRRSQRVVGPGDTHISLVPERPRPGETVVAVVNAALNHIYVDLMVRRPDGEPAEVAFQGLAQVQDRFEWRYRFGLNEAGLYDIRFGGDQGARLLAQLLLRISPEEALEAQARQAPSGRARVAYRRVYVLLPPTADSAWAAAAARGAFTGRYTVGYSADDAGVGDLAQRHVLVVNPHHWPQPLSASWFHQHYPGTHYTAVVASSPDDLEAWLETWDEVDGPT